MFKQGPLWDPLLPLQFPHSTGSFTSAAPVLPFYNAQWKQAGLRLSQEDLLNRSKLVSLTDSKAAFVKGAASHPRAPTRQLWLDQGCPRFTAAARQRHISYLEFYSLILPYADYGLAGKCLKPVIGTLKCDYNVNADDALQSIICTVKRKLISRHDRRVSSICMICKHKTCIRIFIRRHGRHKHVMINASSVN